MLNENLYTNQTSDMKYKLLFHVWYGNCIKIVILFGIFFFSSRLDFIQKVLCFPRKSLPKLGSFLPQQLCMVPPFFFGDKMGK